MRTERLKAHVEVEYVGIGVPAEQQGLFWFRLALSGQPVGAPSETQSP